MPGATPREAAFLFAENGDWRRAVPAARQALGSDPDDAEVMGLLALGLMMLKQTAEAVEIGRRAVAADPHLFSAHYGLGHALLAFGDVAAAESAACETLRLYPDSNAYSLLGHVQVRRRRWAQALETAETGLALDPYHAGCSLVRTQALVGLGRKNEAEEVARNRLSVDPESALSHASRGWVLLGQQKYDEALESFRAALRLDPTLDVARAGFGETAKTKNGLHRRMLRLSLWMLTLDAPKQWLVLVGTFLVARIAREMLRHHLTEEMIVILALGAYTLFAFFLWVTGSLSNVMHRMDPYARTVLTSVERFAFNTTGVCLMTTFVVANFGMATARDEPVAAGFAALLILVMTAGAFAARSVFAWGPLHVTLAALVSFTLAVVSAVALAIAPLGFG